MSFSKAPSGKILIVTDDSGESFEILYAQHRFREAGYEPAIAATKRKLLNGVIHNFDPSWNTYIEKPGYSIQREVTFEEVQADDYVAVMLIGGRAPEFLLHDETLIGLVKEFAAKDKWLFSVCHGTQILAAAGLVAGRAVTSYCNVRIEVTTCGGRWIDQESVVDGKMITAQTWESHADFYCDIFNQLG